jgi:signal transduction histidine kinase
LFFFSKESLNCETVLSTSTVVLSQFVQINAFLMFIAPVIFFSALPETPVFWIWLVLLWSLAVFCASCAVLSTWNAVATVAFWVIPIGMIVKQMQLRNVMILCAHKRVHDIMRMRDQESKDNYADEMRHLIANVAHDLKTVSNVQLP